MPGQIAGDEFANWPRAECTESTESFQPHVLGEEQIPSITVTVIHQFQSQALKTFRTFRTFRSAAGRTRRYMLREPDGALAASLQPDGAIVVGLHLLRSPLTLVLPVPSPWQLPAKSPMRIDLEYMLRLMSRSKLQPSRTAQLLLYFCKMFAVKEMRQMFCPRTSQEAARISNQFANNLWRRYNAYDLAQCDVGTHSLWIKKQVAGWSVELRYPCDVDARVLTIADIPVLCPDEISAMRLALACYPDPVANLAWHSYW
jgi:hypothetical protein